MSQIARWIDEAAAERGDVTYLADARSLRTVGYRDLAEAVADWGERLTGAGVPPGATVATALTNPLDTVLALLGLVATCRVAAPVDPAAPRALGRRRAEPDTVAVPHRRRARAARGPDADAAAGRGAAVQLGQHRRAEA